MSSKQVSGGGEPLYQSSIFRFTKANRRKSTQAVPPRTTTANLEIEAPCIERVGSSINSGGTRVRVSSNTHVTTQTSASALWSSSGISRKLKENQAPSSGLMVNSVSSSPISGLNNTWDQHIPQRENAIRTESEDEDSSTSISAPNRPKRKARDWTIEEHLDRADGERIKRRRQTSSNLRDTSHTLLAPPSGEIRADPDHQQQDSTGLSRYSSAVTESHNLHLCEDKDGDFISDPGYGPLIESSQTQPLLSPERAAASSPRPSIWPSQASNGAIIGSSQTPSPLKSDSQHLTAQTVGFMFISPLHMGSTPPSNALETPEVHLIRHRRAPEPGTVSLFGIRGAGVSSPPEVSLEIGSPSKRAFHSGVKLIRRPGRHSVPFPLVLPDPSTLHISGDSKNVTSLASQPQARRPSSSYLVPLETSPPESSLFNLVDSPESENRIEDQPSDSGPFWETQPLLGFDFEAGSSPSSPTSSPPLCMPSSLKGEPPRVSHVRPANSARAKTTPDTSGSDTESGSLLPPLWLMRRNVPSADPDETVVASTPAPKWPGATTRVALVSRRKIVAANNPSTEAEGREEDGEDCDRTMVNLQPNTVDEREKVSSITDVTRDLQGLSPFKRARKRPEMQAKVLGLLDSRVVQIREHEDDKSVGPLHTASHHDMSLREETQDDLTYTQVWPGTSLPSGWNAFETPKKHRQERHLAVGANQSKPESGGLSALDGCDEDEGEGGDDRGSDDIFGPEVTPQTLEREKPDVVRAFEDLPSPYPGMFSGSVDGESDSEPEVSSIRA